MSMRISVCHHVERASMLALITLILGASLTAASAVGAEPCPNEAIRGTQSATALPDCRAYELVSPPGGVPYMRGGANHLSIGAQASSLGGGIAWYSLYPLPGSLGGQNNLSRRGPGGWTTESVIPSSSTRQNTNASCDPAMFFSSDLSMGVLLAGWGSVGGDGEPGEEGYCGSNDPSLVAGEPEGVQNIFVRDGATGAYSLVNASTVGGPPADAFFQDASADFSHVLFTDSAPMTASAPAGANLYEWVGGGVHLVTVLPDGAPSVGVLPGAVVEQLDNRGTASVTHPMSADGTRVVFESGGALYLRVNVAREQSPIGPGGVCLESDKACTVQLDASRTGGQGGGGVFLAANAADTKVFFSDEEALTAGSAGGAGQHLYEYDTLSGTLVDLTPAGGLALDGLSGISDDGSYLYFGAGGVLASGATLGEPNLYVWHDGKFGFIATLTAEDYRDLSPGVSTARVSPNGRYLGFTSVQSLTGYDNQPAPSGRCLNLGVSAPCAEIFLYDATAASLSCVSCGAPDKQPTGPTEIQYAEETTESVAGLVHLQRNVLDDGRVFFDSANSLLPAAANGVSNVYEYSGAQLSLISSGSSPENSYFYDASPNGDDVFFITAQHLVSRDAGNSVALYDARTGGGFPEPAAAAACGGEGCKGPGAAAPAVDVLASTGLQGAGNLPAPTVGHTGAVKSKRKVLTRKQKLHRALVQCRHEKKKYKRAACERRARTSMARGR